MPRSAYIYTFIILVAGVGGLLLAANLLNVERSWSQSLTEVKDKNEEQAISLVAQRRAATELQAALAQANLGWDRTFFQVETTPNQQNGNLQLRVGSDNGISATAEAPMILHAFRPDAEGYIYVGPFLARAENIRNADCTLIPGWSLLARNNRLESTNWGNRTNWRFRTQIPTEHKVRFESTIGRFGTNLQTLVQKQASISKQDVLLEKAGEQLEQRTSELIGTDDPDAKIDPLKPELTIGLVNTLEAAEESRNLLQTEIDTLRRAILDVRKENDALEGQINKSPSGALDSKPARIGSRK